MLNKYIVNLVCILTRKHSYGFLLPVPVFQTMANEHSPLLVHGVYSMMSDAGDSRAGSAATEEGSPKLNPRKLNAFLVSWCPPSSPCSVLCSFFARVSKNDRERQRLMIRDFLKYPPAVWLLYIINSDTLYVDFAGFVVGHAGLLHGLLMLFVAYFIISLTILSICAISTNGAVEGGGAYCILNQSLCHIEC